MKKITIEDLEGRFRSLEKIVFDHIGTPEKPARYEYTFEDLIEATESERNRIRVIIEYICNKNSKPLSQGGVQWEQLFDDIQDLERSLQE